MSNNAPRRRRHRHPIMTFILTLVLVLLIGATAILYTDNPVKEGIVGALIDQAADKFVQDHISGKSILKETAENSNNSKVSNSAIATEEILSRMSEDDKATVTEIITENVTPTNIVEINQYVQDGDTAGLMEYAAENLSTEDMAKLSKLYLKYGVLGADESGQ